jgi:hypothetical protein
MCSFMTFMVQITKLTNDKPYGLIYDFYSSIIATKNTYTIQ